jgi:carbamoyl-phosphate synthase large subunit
LPSGGTGISSVADRDNRANVCPVKRLIELGFQVLATEGTASVLRRNGIDCQVVRKYSERTEGEGETIVDLIAAGRVDMVVNTPSGQGSRADGYEIRTATTGMDKPIVTTVQQLGAAVQGIEARRQPYRVVTLQELDAAR